MKAGDLCRVIKKGLKEELFVDLQWCDTGFIKECYQAANFTKL